MIQIYLITCKKTSHRLQNCIKHASSITNNITIITDHDVGSDLFASFKNQYFSCNTPALWRNQTLNRAPFRILSDSEISLFAKHMECWNIISTKSNDLSIVIEDDFSTISNQCLLNKFFSRLERLAFTAYDLIYFGETISCSTSSYTKILKQFAGPDNFLYRVPYSYFADAYCISPILARKLINNINDLSAPVDDYIISKCESARIYETKAQLSCQDPIYETSMDARSQNKTASSCSDAISLKDRLLWYISILRRFQRIIFQSNKII